MKTYQILSTIRYKGKDLKSGLVTLEGEMAAALLRSGHIVGPIDTQFHEKAPVEPSLDVDSAESAAEAVNPSEATKSATRSRGKK